MVLRHAGALLNEDPADYGRGKSGWTQHGYDKNAVRALADQPADEERPILKLMRRHKAVFRWFDDWLIVRPQADGVSIGEIVMKPRTEEHIETIRW